MTDANGKELKAGDRVVLKGTIESIHGQRLRVLWDQHPSGYEVLDFVKSIICEKLDDPKNKPDKTAA